MGSKRGAPAKVAARRVSAKAKAKATTKPSAAARPAPGAAPALRKVAFTMFQISDPERARAFYEGPLGLERGLHAPHGTWTEYDLPGGGCLALFCHPDKNAARPGGGNIAFEVDDLDRWLARMAEVGQTARGGVIKGPHCRMGNFVDPDGNGVILHQLDRR